MLSYARYKFLYPIPLAHSPFLTLSPHARVLISRKRCPRNSSLWTRGKEKFPFQPPPDGLSPALFWGRWAKVDEKPTTLASLFSPVGWRNRERVTRCLVARSVVLCSLRLGEGENAKGSRVGRVQGRGSLVEERGRKQRTQYAPKRRRS